MDTLFSSGLQVIRINPEGARYFGKIARAFLVAGLQGPNKRLADTGLFC